ncbi:MAG: thioredoxin domain-containing protein [Bacteroidetes bacterium]|nr:thioredoxin domain-containing protein [Bacteroidota bacterium]MBS1649332.1 thioredoxin domain-containing protein [Bacteroidota bacterium]
MHTNHLINETSPYLLQHAHNPVNWYPWCKEALEKAEKEDKPILVSIGYAACHWCHVMEKESFEDETIATLMNEFFINIKVDREERPDLDHIYMDAVQAISGSGGWPLNVFLTPNAKPFYGGTYFPPHNAYNRISWKELITSIHQSFKEKKHEIIAQADNLTQHLFNANIFHTNANHNTIIFNKDDLEIITSNILKQADTVLGGFGKAPKFPQTFSIQYLLRQYYFFKNEAALQQALLSIDKMIMGGIYDHIGGGFSRYSTDAQWVVPHFEKMLYDNALLINVLCEAYQITKNKKYAEVIEQTIDFVEREMLDVENGFYSAIDADSEGVEGKFYTWSKKEIELILQEDASLFCAYYQITENGNWHEETSLKEHTNILFIKQDIELFANENNINDVEALKNKFKTNKHILLNYRNKKIRPLTDDKILLGWNALMCTALCKAYAALGNKKYKALAIANMNFLEEKLFDVNNNWQHTYKNGIAKISAFLDDYAFLIQAYIHLQEISSNNQYLQKAKQATEFVLENFSDTQSPLFFFTQKTQSDIIVQKKEVYDGATPSGNAVMAFNLQYLAIIFNISGWKEQSITMFQLLHNAIIRYPTSFGIWALVYQNELMGLNEIVISGKNVEQNLLQVLQLYIPNKIIQSSSQKADEIFPLLHNRIEETKTQFFLCQNYSCNIPEENFSAFLHLCNNKSLILAK